MKTERTSDDLWTQRTLSTFQTFARGQDHKNLGGVPQTNTNGFHHSLNGNGHSANSNGGTNGHGLGDRTSPHEEANGLNIKNNGFGTTTTTIIINGSGSSNSPPLKSNGHGQGGQHHSSAPNKAKSVPVPVPVMSPTNHHNHNHQHGHHRSLSVENNQNHMNHQNSFNTPLPPPVHSHSLSYTSADSDYNMSPFILTDEDEQLLIVQVTLEKGDRRFGFSVIGGRDEGFPPCIDEISTGSPADKADLEVGDEILEVNGRSLEDATHTEVISHIHQCIRSRTICLRVKRRSGNKLALDLASQSNVQDAFVIAVEQQARERLEKLSALKKIKPVDMTKLSHQLSEAPSGSGDTSELNGLIEAATGSPIYVTSAAELSSSNSALHRSGVVVGGGGDDDAAGETFDSSHQQDSENGGGGVAFSRTGDPSLSPGTTRHRSHSSSPSAHAISDSANGNVTVVGVSSSSSNNKKLSPLLTNGHSKPKISTSVVVSASDSGSSVVTVSDVSKPSGHHQNKLVVSGTSLPNGQYTLSSSASEKDKTTTATAKKSVSKESVNSKKTSSRENIADGVDIDGAKPLTEGKTSKPQSQNSSRESIVDSAQYANMINMVEWDNGPHREMAVDVPDSFVPRNKTPPRYPPTNKSTTLNSNNNKTPNKSGVGAKGNGTATLPGHSGQNGAAGKPIPPPRISEKDGWSVNNNNTQAPHVPPRTLVSPDKSAEVSPSRDQAERIRKYQEELKKRREHEEKQAKEEEFLRASLRGSKKLQALESRVEQTPSPSGFINDAYDEEEHRIPYSQHSHDTIPLQKTVGLSELVTSLQRVQQALKKNGLHLDETVSAVGSLMQTPEFQQVLAVHNKVQDVWCFNPPPTPISAHGHQLVQECLGSLLHCSVPESAELVDLLSRVDLEGVLYAHDKIAERERLLLTIESPLNLGESVDDVAPPKTSRPAFVPEPQPDAHIKVVRIEKTQDPLGATVRNEGDAVVIGRIVKGGAAERSGLLHEGDEVLEVNGIEMRGKSVNEVCDILSRMTGTLTFLIVPSPSPPPPISQRREILIHVRAHFDYDPEDDIYVPCRELGIAFGKGDVLHVISQDDPNWWQAHREGEEDQALAGLIPSKFFQEQREAVKQTLLGETETREKTKKGTLLCAKTHKKKKKKIPYSTAFNDEFDADEIPTYEEVALYYPRASFKRPVVLIGPPNIGRHELRQRLMHESDRFAAAVPHTSRTKKEAEVDGQDYHFITRAQFESDILARKFVEHGEFEKAYYGTSLDAIQSVVNIGKICVLNLHPQSLKILRTSNLKPYIVFVAPPPLERLKQMRISRGEAYKEEELIDIIEKAREMEEKYGHFFDLVIVNNDIERTYHELIQRINYIEREPQWVPAVWLKQ